MGYRDVEYMHVSVSPSILSTSLWGGTTSKAYGHLFRRALAHAENIIDGSHAFTTFSNGWQYPPLPIAQRRLAKMMVIRSSCCLKYLHPKVQILTYTQNLGGLLRRHRGRNRRWAVAGNTFRVCRSACASNTWTPSSAAEKSERDAQNKIP
jgi:hypothetical protein